MRICDFISDCFRGPDPTRNWVERPAVPLEFDLDACSLGGVPNGSRIEQFNWLGPAESRWTFRDGTRAFAWFSKGLELLIEGDSFHFRLLSFEPPGAGRHQPFPGTLILHGRRIHIRPASTEAEVVALVGEATRRTEDEGFIETLFYRIGQYEYRFDFGEEGKLAEMYCAEAESDGTKE